jgi:transcription initiation factor TFIIB
MSNIEFELEFAWDAFDKARQEEKPIMPATTIKKDFSCEHCNGHQIIDENDFRVCTECGVVDMTNISDEAEWVNGVNEDGSGVDKSRCGPPQDLELFSSQWGNSSILTATGKQTYAQKKMARIAFHQSMNHRDRALFHAYKSFDAAAEEKLHLPPNVIRSAKIMYRKFNSEKLTRGAIRTGIKANCIIYACKLEKIPRTTKEVAAAFDIPTKDVSRTADMFRTTMLDETKLSDNNSTQAISKPENVVTKFVGLFDIENARAFRMKCIKFSKLLEECVQLMGKTPSSVAGVIIFKVSEGEITKQEIVEKCGISMPTLNKIENIINKYLEGLTV